MSAEQKLSPLRSRGYLFSCFVFAIFFAWFPRPTRADALEDAARALARKVASNHRKNLDSSYVWENHASVSPATSERMREAFEVELERLLRMRVDHVSEADVSILITESTSQIRLLAKVSSQDGGLVDAVALPKGEFTAEERNGNVLTIERQLLWQQPEPILDIAQSNDSSGRPDVMLVLSTESLSLYRWNQEKWLLKDTAVLPGSKPRLRGSRGEIHLDDHFFQFHLPGLECDGDGWQKLSFECEEQKGIWEAEFHSAVPFSLDPGRNFFAVNPHYIGPNKFPLAGFFAAAASHSSRVNFIYDTTLAGADGHTYVYSSGDGKNDIPESVERLPVEWGSDLASVSINCHEGFVVIASGGRDYSLPDRIQGFEVDARAVTPMTTVAEFSGPVLSLKSENESEAVAIVFNLTTGNYEAYRVTISCHN